MKFRLVLGTVALSALFFAPSGIAQQQPDPNAGSTPDAPAKSKAPDDSPATDTSSKDTSKDTKPAGQDSSSTSQSPTSQTPTATPADTKAADTKAADTKVSDKPADAPLPVIAQPDDSKVKHDGSKSDVNAIGNRKVGGRGLGDWYSLEGEIRMGKQYAQEVEATSKLVRDPVVTEYVNRIGQNLVRNSDAQVPFTIKVIDSDEVNAFALP